MDDIRQLEEISANAWNAPYVALYDGWLMRCANGYTRRANSVLPFYNGHLPLEEKITYCEAFYTARSLATILKLTEASQPANLDAWLARTGYDETAHTSVQTLKLARFTAALDVSDEHLDLRPYPSRIWLDVFYELNQIRPAYYSLIRHMMTDHLLQPAQFVLLWKNSEPIALALMVLERGYAGIFDVVVHERYRGQGYGRRMMGHLLTSAQESGARTAYLQVMLENEPAQRLYHSLGFRELYQYWYRVKPLQN